MQTRKYIRYKTDIPISFVMDGTIGTHQHFLKDAGRGGLCIYAKGCIGQGTHLTICNPFSNELSQNSGKIIWCRTLDTGHILLGIEFEKLLTQSNLEIMIHQDMFDHQIAL